MKLPVFFALLSGLLLALTAEGGVSSLLAWVALVPLLVALPSVGPLRALGVGWIAGVVYFFATFWWLAVTLAVHTRIPAVGAVAAVLLLASACALQLALFAWAVRLHGQWRGTPSVVFPAVLWAVLEWIRTSGPLPFPPGSLAYSQDTSGALLQIVEYTGIYGPAAVIAAVNAALAGLFTYRDDGWRSVIPVAVVATVLVLVSLVGRDLRQHAEKLEAGPAGVLRIVLVQPDERPAPERSHEEGAAVLGRLEDLTRAVDAEQAHLVVWPEGAFPAPFADEETLREDPMLFGPAAQLRSRLEGFVRELGVPLLFGAAAVEVREAPSSGDVWSSFNSVVLMSRIGRMKGQYDKMLLVPFGERVPFPGVLSFVEPVVPAIGRLEPGRRRTLFEIPRASFRVLVCYEAIVPDFVRRHAGPDTDFLVNVTNDVWFRDTEGVRLHFRMAAVRAVETRLPLVRVANGGTSGVVDPSGAVRDRIPGRRSGALIAEIPRRERPPTFYVRHGDVFALVSGLVAGVLFVYAGVRSRFSRRPTRMVR